MDRTFNVRTTKKRRQYLRRNMTKGEKLFWTSLRVSVVVLGLAFVLGLLSCNKKQEAAV